MFERKTYASEQGEKKDCSIRSFAVAACVSYDSALNLFSVAGRDHNKGTPQWVTEKVIDEQFPGAFTVTGPGLTLPKFAVKYNEGHWIVHIRGHALAIVDGVIHDWAPRPRTKVRKAWRLV